MWRTRAANSSGLPSRFGNGICCSSDSRMSSLSRASIGVSAGPGAIVITRIPARPRSRAIGSVIPTTPAFDAEYAAWPICPSKAAFEAVLTITPRSPSSVKGSFSAIFLAACFVTTNVPTRLTSTTLRNASRSYSVTRDAQPMPAQLTAPWSSSSPPISASTAASSLTSHSGRSATTARAPAPSSSCTVAAPSPDLPPVTSTVLPSSFNGVPGELLAERGLPELANRRLRNLLDELDAVGQLPLRELRRDELAEIVARRVLALLQHDDGQRPLLPLLVRHSDHRGLRDGRVAHDRVLERDGGDPLAARLDDVLRAVLDVDAAALLDGHDV